MEGVSAFKYLGRPLDQTEYDWMGVIQNAKRAQRLWRRLGKFRRREWEGPKAEAILCREVT